QNLDIPPLPERKFETRTLTVEPPANAAPAPSAKPSDKLPTVDTKAPSTFEAPDADKPGADKDVKTPAPAATPPKPPATEKPAAVDTKPAPAEAKPPIAETAAAPG